MRVAILAHEQFPDRAKTAICILRYSDDTVVGVLDRDRAGDRVSDHVTDVQDAPIVASMDALSGPVDALIIGIAPIGGGFDDSWRADVKTALRSGADVIAGLHYLLSEDDEFAALAAEHDATLRDVREPPTDLTVASGSADDVDATVITTVGTDCAVGKMTTTMELTAALTKAGYDAAAVPTGQTGIMIEGWGIAVDRVIGDFVNGAVERLVEQAARDHDVLVVEGQGSIVHPAYSAVTCGIVHGSMPDAMVLVHDVDREVVHGYESFELPSLPTYVDLYESLAAPVSPAPVVAGAVNTSSLTADNLATEAVTAFEETTGLPATDPVRFDAGALAEEVMANV